MVSFLARRIPGRSRDTTKLTDGQGVILHDVLHDQASGYSRNTGRYRVTVAGTYVITATIQGTNRGNNITEALTQIFLTVDSQDYLQVATHMLARAGTQDCTSLMAVVHLSAGQEVWLQVKGYSTWVWIASKAHTFGGALILPDSGLCSSL